MDKMLQEELSSVSGVINQMIEKDPFPNGVAPVCLASAVRSYPVRGGKRLRPAILLWSCLAAGGDPDTALYAACAVEIFHSWTLVHDDIIDEDEVRRGCPTSHVEIRSFAQKNYRRTEVLNEKFGRDMAILCGDIQQAWAMNMLMKTQEKGVDPALVLALMNRFQYVNRKLISGEAMDVEFPMLDSVREKDVYTMISGKTSCLLKFAAQCGGAIGLGTADFDKGLLAALGTYAEDMGIAFQLRDDYLGVYGDFKTFGKPLCSDFHEAKPTPLYLMAKEMLPESGKKRLAELTGLPEYPVEKVEEVRSLLHDCGADAALLKKIGELTETACRGLDSLPENRGRELLAKLLDYLLARTV